MGDLSLVDSSPDLLIVNQILNSTDIIEVGDLIIELQDYYSSYSVSAVRDSVFTHNIYLEHPTLTIVLQDQEYYKPLSECIGTYLSSNYIPDAITLNITDIATFATPIRNHLNYKMEYDKWNIIKNIYNSLYFETVNNIVGDSYWTNYIRNLSVDLQKQLNPYYITEFGDPLRLLNEFYPINISITAQWDGWIYNGVVVKLGNVIIDGKSIKVDMKGNKIVNIQVPNNDVLK